MRSLPTRSYRGLWLTVAAALMLAAPAVAQRPPVRVTDADVDAMIKAFTERLFSLQSADWVIQVYEREPRRGEAAGAVPRRLLTGKLIGKNDGYVQFRPAGGKKLKVPGEFVVSLTPPTNRGGDYRLVFRTRRQRRGEPIGAVPRKTVTGRLLKHVKTSWLFVTDAGKKLTIPLDLAIALHGPGHFSTTETLARGGGVTALATLALLKAGVSPKNPKMKMALDYLRGYEDQGAWSPGSYGTYAKSLRANVWEHLLTHGGAEGNRSGHRKLLVEDARYLEDGISNTGWYSYATGYDGQTGKPRKDHAGDHSNSQFGVLGMWAAATARIEISSDYWKVVNAHWLKFQRPDGAWQYTGGAPGAGWAARGSITMTTAGLNSLFLVLDLFHSRGQGAYVRFAGISPNPKAAKEVERVFKAIDAGLEWMRRNARAPGTAAYYSYGLERLGVASGLKRIGGHDWYREGAANLYTHRAAIGNRSAVDASFLLMFLAYGRAPIVFNKLRNPKDTEWNYYYRDLHYMCRFLTTNFERIHKWQVVSLEEHAEEDLADAPITYLAGTKKPEFEPGQLAKLKDYLEDGGTLVLHATRRSGAFAKGAKEVFEDLFKDRGYEFAALPDDHPVYKIHYGRGRGLKGMDFEGLSDGARTFIYLMPKDIAGAWQQNLEGSHRDLFEVMANLRIYAAPGYFELPSRLRDLAPVGTPMPPLGALRIARVQHTAHCNANPTMWRRLNRTMTHETGLTAQLAAAPVALAGAQALANVDLLQLVGHGTFALTANQVQVLGDWLKAGGMLLIDASGGKEKFADAAETLFGELRRATGGAADMVGVGHKLITGKMPRAKAAGAAVYNRWGLAEAPGGGAPNLKTLKIGGRDAVLFSPIDLSATANGHFIHGMASYKPAFARRLMTNIALLRWHQLHPPAAGTPTP